MIRLTRSYRGAIASNIARTARTFSSPFGNEAGGALVRRHVGGDRIVIHAHGTTNARTSTSAASPSASTGRSGCSQSCSASQAREGWLLVAWVAIVLVSILVHELGHAFTMRAFQQRPHVTAVRVRRRYRRRQRRRGRRSESIIISLAGPLSALVLLGIPAYCS